MRPYTERRQFDTSSFYYALNSKARSDVQPHWIGPRTVKTGRGFLLFARPLPQSASPAAGDIRRTFRLRANGVVRQKEVCTSRHVPPGPRSAAIRLVQLEQEAEAERGGPIRY